MKNLNISMTFFHIISIPFSPLYFVPCWFPQGQVYDNLSFFMFTWLFLNTFPAREVVTRRSGLFFFHETKQQAFYQSRPASHKQRLEEPRRERYAFLHSPLSGFTVFLKKTEQTNKPTKEQINKRTIKLKKNPFNKTNKLTRQARAPGFRV